VVEDVAKVILLFAALCFAGAGLWVGHSASAAPAPPQLGGTFDSPDTGESAAPADAAAVPGGEQPAADVKTTTPESAKPDAAKQAN